MAFTGFRGHCLALIFPSSTSTSPTNEGGLLWLLTEGNRTLLTGRVYPDTAESENGWQKIGLSFQDPLLTAFVADNRVGSVSINNSDLKLGRVGLVSGWNEAHFDDFSVNVMNTTYGYS